MNSETVIVGIVTAVLTYLGTRTKGQFDVKRQKVESETNSEGMYVENMSVILSEYKEQVSGFRDEVRQLREENEGLKQSQKSILEEFEAFRKSHFEKIDEYKKYVELVEAENEELREENAELKLEVSYLKGEND